MKSHRPASSAPTSPSTQPSPNPALGRSNQDAIAALQEVAEQEPEHPILHAIGENFGLGAGVLVTELLALVPGWGDDLLDEEGTPVQAVEGAERQGDYNLEKRHTQVVGPAIAEYAAGLEPGMWRDLLSGVGEGASEAPGASYRLEASVAEHLSETWGSGD